MQLRFKWFTQVNFAHSVHRTVTLNMQLSSIQSWISSIPILSVAEHLCQHSKPAFTVQILVARVSQGYLVSQGVPKSISFLGGSFLVHCAAIGVDIYCACMLFVEYVFLGTLRPTNAPPAEANIHWTGNSLIFIFIARDSASLHFVQWLVTCGRASLVYEPILY